MLPPDHPAVPHPEQHADRIVPVAREPDHVGVAAADDLHRWRLLELLQPPQRVPQLAGALVVLALRWQSCITSRDPRPHVLGPALEEVEHVVDHPAVLLLALPADARRPAPADVVVETGPLPPLPREVVVTGSHGEDAPDDRQRPPQLADVGVGAEVPGAGDVAPPGHQHPRGTAPPASPRSTDSSCRP